MLEARMHGRNLEDREGHAGRVTLASLAMLTEGLCVWPGRFDDHWATSRRRRPSLRAIRPPDERTRMEESAVDTAFDAATSYVGAASTSGVLSDSQLLQFYG